MAQTRKSLSHQNHISLRPTTSHPSTPYCPNIRLQHSPDEPVNRKRPVPNSRPASPRKFATTKRTQQFIENTQSAPLSTRPPASDNTLGQEAAPYDIHYQTAPSAPDVPARPGRDDVAPAARLHDSRANASGEDRCQPADSIGPVLHPPRRRHGQLDARRGRRAQAFPHARSARTV